MDLIKLSSMMNSRFHRGASVFTFLRAFTILETRATQHSFQKPKSKIYFIEHVE